MLEHIGELAAVLFAVLTNQRVAVRSTVVKLESRSAGYWARSDFGDELDSDPSESDQQFCQGAGAFLEGRDRTAELLQDGQVEVRHGLRF